MSELRYEISDWHQLVKAKSNNSDQLYITVGDIVQNDTLTGLRIQLQHRAFGTLFACVRNASGAIVTPPNSETSENISDDQIIAELAKYGFHIVYTYPQHLPSAQLEFLITLKALQFDKIRTLTVRSYKNGVEVRNSFIVAFLADVNSKWLSNTYAPTKSEYMTALENGSAFNISQTATAHEWDWSWLTFVANIDDILAENALT